MFSLEMEKWDWRWSLKSLSDLTFNELMRYLSSIAKHIISLPWTERTSKILIGVLSLFFWIQLVEFSNDTDLWSATKIESRLLESYWWSIYFVSFREKWDILISRYLIFHKEFGGRSRIITHFNLLKKKTSKHCGVNILLRSLPS